MLPFKYKNRKVEEISFRNAAPHNMNLYLRVHTSPASLPYNDLNRSIDYFDSEPTEYPTIVSREAVSLSKCFYLWTEPQVRD